MEQSKQDLLKRFLKGGCTGQELAEVRNLLNQPEAKAFLDELIALDTARVEETFSIPEPVLQEKSKRLKDQLLEKMGGDDLAAPKKRWLFPKRLMQHAAIWTGIALVSAFLLWQSGLLPASKKQVATVTRENRKGIPIKYMLPDSTTVFLAAGSQLTYREDFPKAGRDIQLNGEAFFDVTPDKEHPFTIYTGEVSTRVLGTSFKVSAFDGQSLEVAVATGKVVVATTGKDRSAQQLAALTPGMKVSYDRHTLTATIGSTDISSLEQWTDGDIIFDGKPLEQVLAELRRRFAVKIYCNDHKITSRLVTGSLPAGYPVDKALELLGDLAAFNVKKEDPSTFNLYQK